LAEGGIQAGLLAAALTLAAAGIGIVTGSLPSVILGGTLVLAAAWRFFIPVTFELTAMGISQQFLGLRRRVPWSSIDRAEICRHGLYVSLDGVPLAPLRGLYVPWNQHREAVLALVDYYLPRTRQAAS
jgi:hypothetical protein